MLCEAIKQIEHALQHASTRDGISRPSLKPEECRRAVYDYSTMRPEHRRQVLLQVLIDFLRHPSRPDFKYDLRHFLVDLNVAAGPDSAHYDAVAKKWGTQQAEAQRRIHKSLADRYRQDHDAMSAEEAAAVLAFLEAVRTCLEPDEELADGIALRDWAGAVEYWRRRAARDG